MTPRILLVDDELDIRKSFKILLTAEGFSVAMAKSGDEALRLFDEAKPDLVLMDVMMPVKGGISACEELRSRDPLVPILFLSAVPNESTVVRALSAGGDDYILKSAPPDLLVARIRAALRRSDAEKGIEQDAPIIRLGAIEVNLTTFKVADGGSTIAELTKTESLLLVELNRRRGEYLSNEELFAAIHGDGYVGDVSSVRSLIRLLRNKLGRAREMIQNNPNVGYKLVK